MDGATGPKCHVLCILCAAVINDDDDDDDDYFTYNIYQTNWSIITSSALLPFLYIAKCKVNS